MRKFLKSLTILMAVFLIAFAPVTTYAATKYVKSTSKEGASKTIKTGKTVVTAKSKSPTSNYVRFKAPRTKTYKITVRNLRTLKDSSRKSNISAYMSFYKGAGKSVGNDGLSFVQQGTQVNALWLHSAYTKSYQSKTAYAMLPSRTVNIRLNKGDVVYIDYIFNGASGSKYDIIIK